MLRAVKKVYIWRLRIRGKARKGKECEGREERAREMEEVLTCLVLT